MTNQVSKTAIDKTLKWSDLHIEMIYEARRLLDSNRGMYSVISEETILHADFIDRDCRQIMINIYLDTS